MEVLLELKRKSVLDASDARLVLQLIQQLTCPILSVKGSTSSTIPPAFAKSEKQFSSSHTNIQSLGSPNIGSLEDFPTLTLQARSAKPSSKTKRRITPTVVKPQLSGRNAFQNGSNVASRSSTFTLHTPADLTKALKEDRDDIQKEIVLRRKEQDFMKRKPVLSEISNGSNRECYNVEEISPRLKQADQVQTSNLKGSPNLSSGTARKDVLPPPGFSSRKLFISSLTNLEGLHDLSVAYARIIKEYLVPSVISELYFLLQLLTLTTSFTAPTFQGNTTNVFRTVEDCIYFSVVVMDTIKELFLLLDRSSLHLLANNHWVSLLKPQVKEYFIVHLQIPSTDQGSVMFSDELVSGCFQEAIDNNRNFPDMKAFHAFKKQRDLFYSLLREWESNHEVPKWSMKDSCSDRIQTIVRHYGEICCCSYFAKLFLRQLVESCHCSMRKCRGTEWLDNDINHLKMDPGRLVKLAQRFYTPMSNTGASSSPSFANVEEFFADFISISDSYTFNYHLKLILSEEIRQILGRISSIVTDTNKYFNVLLSVRVMTKFLGFLDFLPFSKSSRAAAVASRYASLDLVECLDESGCGGHLCVAVPSLVEYLSMMDVQAATHQPYRTLLLLLIAIYKSFSGYEFASNVGYIIISTLGWLFEIPNFPSDLFLENGIELPKSLVFGHVPNSLDRTLTISTDSLHLCCPFMNNFRVLLAEYNSGLQSKANPRRKIKPLSTAITLTEHIMTDLQLQVVDVFFRNHPPYLKQLCEVTTERLFGLVVHELEQYIFPKYVAMAYSEALRWLKDRISKDNDDVAVLSELEADSVLGTIVTNIHGKLEDEVPRFVTQYCRSHSESILRSLFSDILKDEVFSTACKITSLWSIQKCLKWTNAKAKASVQEKVSTAFRKSRHKILLSYQATPEREQKAFLSSTQRFSHFILDPSYSSYTDAISSLLAFKEKLKSGCHKLCTEDIVTELSSINSLMEQTCFIGPGLPSLEVMSSWQDFIHSVMNITVHFVSNGYLASYEISHHCHQTCRSFLDHLRAIWRKCKDLKLEICIEKCMALPAFKDYLERISSDEVIAESVWLSLANTLTVAILDGVTSSPVVEGLWLCRLRQKKTWNSSEYDILLKGCGLFLKSWFNISEAALINSIKEIHFYRLSCFISSNTAYIS